MKREKRLTKRERKAADAQSNPGSGHTHDHDHQHIHCIACGRHIDPNEFETPATATIVTCEHGSNFPSCVGCVTPSKALLAEHDRTGKPVKTAGAWH